jgi:hypothetical protein
MPALSKTMSPSRAAVASDRLRFCAINPNISILTGQDTPKALCGNKRWLVPDPSCRPTNLLSGGGPSADGCEQNRNPAVQSSRRVSSRKASGLPKLPADNAPVVAVLLKRETCETYEKSPVPQKSHGH